MKRLQLRARFTLVLVALLIATFTAITLIIIRQTTYTLRAAQVSQAPGIAVAIVGCSCFLTMRFWSG